MKQINIFFRITVLFVIVCAVLSACASSPSPTKAPLVASADQLDAAIRETSDYLNNQLPAGNKLMILNVLSDFPALSEYIIDELIANTVNDKVFTVVDRNQLNTIRAELNFQMSGEVDDQTAQSLGRLAGAQTIISGAVSKIGDLYRLRIRALSVQSAQIEGQFNRNIPEGETILALVTSKATGYGDGPAVTGSNIPPASTSPASPNTLPQEAEVSVSVVQETVYKIGDTGPAGGIIFYDKGNNVDGWRYLEAAPASTEEKALQWLVSGINTRANGVDVGAGKQNTKNIMDASVQAVVNAPAARYCDRLVYGGYDDWYLPSKNELGLMYINLKVDGIGGFSSNFYWSSSQENNNNAWIQNFNYGNNTASMGIGTQYIYSVTDRSQMSVRAIRQF